MAVDTANKATIEIDAGTLRSRDGFDVSLVLKIPVRLHESEVDRAAFGEAFGKGKSVAGSTGRMADYVREKVLAAVHAAPQRDAAEMISDTGDLVNDVAHRLRTPLFAVGLMLDGTPAVTAASTELQQREAEHAAVEASKAAAKHADDLLLRFEDIRRTQPEIAPGKLLMALPEIDRREALRLLFEGAAKKETARLFLAAGVRLFELENDHLHDVADVGHLGATRCLRVATLREGRRLLLGARDGVLVTDPDAPVNPRRLNTTLGGTSALGFNDVTVHAESGSVWATHSERGCEAWRLESGAGLAIELDELLEMPAVAGISGAPRPRAINAAEPSLAVLAFGGVLLQVSGDGMLSELETGGSELADDEVTALVPRPTTELSGRVLAVRATGRVQELVTSGGDTRVIDLATLDRPITAACGVPWLGDIRIAACVENGPIVVVGPEDDVTIEYRSNHSDFAAITASAGRLAAVTSDRQRIVVWNLGRPDAPELDLFVLSETRSRVADVAFL